MNDTVLSIQEKMDRIYLNKSGEEKLLIALKMFETVKDIVLSSFHENISDTDLRIELFLRYFGYVFEYDGKEKIIAGLKKAK